MHRVKTDFFFLYKVHCTHTQWALHYTVQAEWLLHQVDRTTWFLSSKKDSLYPLHSCVADSGGRLNHKFTNTAGSLAISSFYLQANLESLGVYMQASSRLLKEAMLDHLAVVFILLGATISYRTGCTLLNIGSHYKTDASADGKRHAFIIIGIVTWIQPALTAADTDLKSVTVCLQWFSAAHSPTWYTAALHSASLVDTKQTLDNVQEGVSWFLH